MIRSQLITLCILFYAFNTLGQGGPNNFKLTIINNSNGIAVCTALQKMDTLNAGQKKVIIYELGDDPLSFVINVMTTDTTSSLAQNFYVPILNTSSKEFAITPAGKLEYELTAQEKILDRYRFRFTNNFWKLDPVIHANNNNFSAPVIILWSMCNIDVPTDTIQKYYNMLSPEIGASAFGKKITQYLEKRKLLAIGNTLDNFELPDTSGKIVKLTDIKSNYILLDFWFVRCGACVASFPEVEDLYWKTKRNKLEIVSISIDRKSDREEWLISIMRYYMAWINLNDSRSELASKLAIGNYPTRILLDKNRKIVMLDTNNGQDDFFKRVYNLANK